MTVIARGGLLLAVFNPSWGFTLPMTKRRQWQDPSISEGVRKEEWVHAAARVAAELLGRTLAPDEFPKQLAEIKQYQQSDADGIWKIYELQIFGLKFRDKDKLASGVVAEWCKPKEFGERQPISGTARYIVSELSSKELLPPWR